MLIPRKSILIAECAETPTRESRYMDMREATAPRSAGDDHKPLICSMVQGYIAMLCSSKSTPSLFMKFTESVWVKLRVLYCNDNFLKSETVRGRTAHYNDWTVLNNDYIGYQCSILSISLRPLVLVIIEQPGNLRNSHIIHFKAYISLYRPAALVSWVVWILNRTIMIE
jgi:hypothetical protein